MEVFCSFVMVFKFSKNHSNWILIILSIIIIIIFFFTNLYSVILKKEFSPWPYPNFKLWRFFKVLELKDNLFSLVSSNYTYSFPYPAVYQT